MHLGIMCTLDGETNVGLLAGETAWPAWFRLLLCEANNPELLFGNIRVFVLSAHHDKPIVQHFSHRDIVESALVESKFDLQFGAFFDRDVVSSILCYSMFQSLDASLGLKDLSCTHDAQYLCYVYCDAAL